MLESPDYAIKYTSITNLTTIIAYLYIDYTLYLNAFNAFIKYDQISEIRYTWGLIQMLHCRILLIMLKKIIHIVFTQPYIYF